MVYEDRIGRPQQKGHVTQGQCHDDNCNSHKRRPSPTKGLSEQIVGVSKKTLETNESIFRAVLTKERSRRAAAKAEQNVDLESDDNAHLNGKQTPNMASDNESDQYLVQKEDLERMRLNKSLLHNMKNSICALTKLTEGLGKEISDVTSQHKAATHLWKDVRTRFKEISQSLNSSPHLSREKTISHLKKTLQNISEASSLDCDRVPQKLVLPKIDAGSRPNSTPSILQMQMAQQNEESEMVNASKMSHIKKIARKRSQEKAMKDMDFHFGSVHTNSSSESLNNNVHRQKKKKGDRQVDKSLKCAEKAQERSSLLGKGSDAVGGMGVGRITPRGDKGNKKGGVKRQNRNI